MNIASLDDTPVNRPHFSHSELKGECAYDTYASGLTKEYLNGKYYLFDWLTVTNDCPRHIVFEDHRL